MRTFLAVLVSALVLVTLVGCGSGTKEVATSCGYAPNQTVEAYQYVHGGYIGKAVVKTDNTGNLDVTLNEAFLPHTLAIVDIESDEWNEDNTVSYVSHGNTVYVAKYVVYNGTTYVGSAVGTDVTYVEAGENGEPVGGQDLELLIARNQESMAAYYESIDGGSFKVLPELGGSPIAVTTTGYESLYKRGSTYWNFGKTWIANIEEVEKVAETHGVAYPLDEIRKDGDTWKVADVTTGATLADFKDYFNNVQLAVAKLKTR
jgi:hypothetical protein